MATRAESFKPEVAATGKPLFTKPVTVAFRRPSISGPSAPLPG